MEELIFGTGLSAAKDYKGLLEACSTAVENGIVSFDTAPSYKTEKILGNVLKEIIEGYGVDRQYINIQTKIDVAQMIRGKKFIIEHVKGVLNDLQLEYLDGLLIHWPMPEFFAETWETLQDMKAKGTVKRVGISNVRTRQLYEILSGSRPDMIQIERNPLRTCDEEISLCRKNGIQVQAYSPLCKMCSEIKDSMLLTELSKKYNREIGEIVLRWHIDTGVTPVFTSKNMNRIKKYSQVLKFKLDNEDVKKITSMNKNYKMYLESWACPGY